MVVAAGRSADAVDGGGFALGSDQRAARCLADFGGATVVRIPDPTEFESGMLLAVSYIRTLAASARRARPNARSTRRI